MLEFKKGVSLVTVLLFMLVATIAATATFKWLTSQNNSSAARLWQSDARQSAIAGIESARSWMTYHSNETGAVIEQFVRSNKTPVSLNQVLKQMDGHRFDVSVVGVDLSSSPFKVKVLSTGYGRNGSKHSEFAIFKVKGLYQIAIPAQRAPSNFHFSYYGGSPSIQQGGSAESMVVNGNLTGNEASVTNELIVTGNVTNGSNYINLADQTCIGGNLTLGNEGINNAGDLYVGGDVTGLHMWQNGNTITGDVYFNGDVSIGTNGSVGNDIVGNVTINGNFTNASAKTFRIRSNMCLTDAATINFNHPTQGMFTVDGNVWIPGGGAISGVNGNDYTKVLLGSGSASNVYVQNAEKCAHYYKENVDYYWGTKTLDLSTVDRFYSGENGFDITMTACPTDPYMVHQKKGAAETYPIYYGTGCSVTCPLFWGCNANSACTSGEARRINNYATFSTQGTVYGEVSGNPNFECADAIKDLCLEAFGDEVADGCDNSKYKIPDMLTTGYNSFVQKKVTCESEINAVDPNSVDYTKIEGCRTANKDNLYNGYLVIEFTDDVANKLFRNNTTQNALSGKIIFVAEQTINRTITLPPTTNDAKIMFYLLKGANEVTTTNEAGPRNYFFFSYDDIKKLHANGSDRTWNGSFYMSVRDKCAKIPDISQANQRLLYNPDLVDDLIENGVLCAASVGEANCGGNQGGGEGNANGAVADGVLGGFDDKYVSTGSQLSIELESQYKNTENYPAANALNPSIVVLPRVIYLTRDAIGKLSDYYSVVNLNGASARGQATPVCQNGFPVNGTMVQDPENMLTAGFYRCQYTEGDYSSSFYVQVSGTAGEVPNVHFVGDADVNLNPTGENDMNISLFVSGVEVNQQLPISVDIRMTGDLPNGWNITMADGSDIPWKEDANGQKIYEFNSATAANDREIPVFHITTEAGAGSGSLNFFLQSPVVNAMIVNPFIKSVSITGTALIVRKSIKDYCNLNEDWCSGEYEYLKSIGDEENCNYDGVWVVANGRGCNTVEDNEKWSCYSGNSNSSPITLRSTYADKYCEVFIPPANRGNSIVAAKDAEELPEGHVLYASLKKKRYNLHVGFSKAQSADIIVEKEEPSGVFTEIGKCSDRENGCDFRLTVDTHVRLSVDKNGENFNYWTCSGSSCGDPNRLTEKVPVTIDDDYTFIAHFNERDDHCFFTSFNNVSAFCSSMSDTPECIDKCSSQHCSLGNGVYGDSPDWLMTYTNNKNSWAAPEIDGGYISYNGPNNGNSKNGSQALVLNRVVAGTTGKMTARIKTGLVSANKQNEFLNNGFILRSNADASEYILLNVYGKYSGNSSSGALYARLCYANGQGIPSHSACVEKPVMDAGNAASSITAQTIIALSIDLHTDPQEKHNHVHVDFKYDGSKGVVDFDLERDWSYGSLNDADHQYVGFAMTDGSFRVTDLGWKTTSFPGAVCSAYPSISCSFASKYLGGRVPANTDVEPWVGFSSWFDDKTSCAANVDYYYNGCDVSTSYFYSGSGLSACAGSKEADGPSSILSPTDGLKMNSGTYNFQYEGPHGIAKSNEEIVRNAFVGVVCNDITYTSNCGSFFVGELRPCSKNLMLYNPTSSLQLSSETVVTLSSLSNVRDASLVFDFENLAEGTYVDVSLEDSHGVMTSVRTLAKGSLQFDVEAVSDVYGFNPEQLSKIHLTPSLGSYPSLKSINSSCPNAVSISCSDAKYEGSAWTISTTLTHPESAYKCSVTPSPAIDGYTATLVNCNDGIFTVSDPEFYERLNTGSSPSLSYNFTVNVFVDENADVYSTPEASCGVDSDEYEKAVVSKCAIGGTEVVQGGGVPELTFSIEKCPSYGCAYEVKLSDGTVRENNPTTIPAAGLFDKKWIPPVNTTSPLDERDYHYEVIAKNAEGALYDKCTSESFTVIKAVPATGECSISGDELTLKVTGGNEQASVPVTLVYSDNIGIPIGLSTVNMNTTETRTINLAEKLTTPGTYAITLRVNGNDYPCGSYSVVPGLTLSGCPAGDQEGTSVSFTPIVTGCDDNCTWSVDNGGSITPASGYTSGEVTLTGAAGTTYTLTLERNDGKSKTCSVKFKSEAEERVLTCPNAITGATAGSSNNATPVRVDGCSSSDCSYQIFVSSSEVGSGNNYNGGQVSFTGMPSPGTDPYEYTLKVTYADNESKQCTFNVTYATPSSSSVASSSSAGGCKCTCSDCSTVVVGTDVGVSQTSNGAMVCAFGTRITNVNVNNRKVIINGTDATSYCLNWNSGDNPCATVYSSIAKLDGGYYMEIPAGGWINATVAGATVNPCAGGGGTSSNSAASSSSATPASSAGGGGTPVPISYQNYKSFTPGNTYTLTFSGSSGSVFRCTYTDRGYSFIMGVYDGSDWNVGANTGGQATKPNPGNGAVKTFVVDSNAPSDLKCATDW